MLHDRIATTTLSGCKQPFCNIVCGNFLEALAAFLDLPVDPRNHSLTFSLFPSSYAILRMYVTYLLRLFQYKQLLKTRTQRLPATFFFFMLISSSVQCLLAHSRSFTAMYEQLTSSPQFCPTEFFVQFRKGKS